MTSAHAHPAGRSCAPFCNVKVKVWSSNILPKSCLKQNFRKYKCFSSENRSHLSSWSFATAFFSTPSTTQEAPLTWNPKQLLGRIQPNCQTTISHHREPTLSNSCNNTESAFNSPQQLCCLSSLPLVHTPHKLLFSSLRGILVLFPYVWIVYLEQMAIWRENSDGTIIAWHFGGLCEAK